MNKENKKYLIALEVDGTLINSKDDICPATLNYLKKLNKEGHKVIIASGRPIRGIRQYYTQLELDTPAICYNGAYIYPGKEVELNNYKFAFPREIILNIIKDIGYDIIDNIILETNNDIYLLHEDESLNRYFTKDGMVVHLGKVEDTLKEDTMTMLIKVKDVKDSDLIKSIVEKNKNIKLRFWSGHWYQISEIYYDHINKANALKYICNHYGIPLSDVIAFGDAINDLEILQEVGYGFAMCNCEDELRSQVKLITEFDNDHDGIMYELMKIIK